MFCGRCEGDGIFGNGIVCDGCGGNKILTIEAENKRKLLQKKIDTEYCEVCFGAGKYERSFYEKILVRCYNCEGNKVINCKSCNGKSYNIFGHQKVLCTNCTNGKVNCLECNNTGVKQELIKRQTYTECEVCLGTGLCEELRQQRENERLERERLSREKEMKQQGVFTLNFENLRQHNIIQENFNDESDVEDEKHNNNYNDIQKKPKKINKVHRELRRIGSNDNINPTNNNNNNNNENINNNTKKVLSKFKLLAETRNKKSQLKFGSNKWKTRKRKLTEHKETEEVGKTYYDIGILIWNNEYNKILTGPIIFEERRKHIYFMEEQEFIQSDINELNSNGKCMDELKPNKYYATLKPNDLTSFVDFTATLNKYQSVKVYNIFDKYKWNGYKNNQKQIKYDICIIKMNDYNKYSYILLNLEFNVLEKIVKFKGIIKEKELFQITNHIKNYHKFGESLTKVSSYTFNQEIEVLTENKYKKLTLYNVISCEFYNINSQYNKKWLTFVKNNCDVVILQNSYKRSVYILNTVTYDIIDRKIVFKSFDKCAKTITKVIKECCQIISDNKTNEFQYNIKNEKYTFFHNKNNLTKRFDGLVKYILGYNIIDNIKWNEYMNKNKFDNSGSIPSKLGKIMRRNSNSSITAPSDTNNTHEISTNKSIQSSRQRSQSTPYSSPNVTPISSNGNIPSFDLTNSPNVDEWNIDDVSNYIEDLGKHFYKKSIDIELFEEYAGIFNENKISGTDLVNLNMWNLEIFGIQNKKHRSRIIEQISKVKQHNNITNNNNNYSHNFIRKSSSNRTNNSRKGSNNSNKSSFVKQRKGKDTRTGSKISAYYAKKKTDGKVWK